MEVQTCTGIGEDESTREGSGEMVHSMKDRVTRVNDARTSANEALDVVAMRPQN